MPQPWDVGGSNNATQMPDSLNTPGNFLLGAGRSPVSDIKTGVAILNNHPARYHVLRFRGAGLWKGKLLPKAKTEG